jgi:hypothetical protein
MVRTPRRIHVLLKVGVRPSGSGNSRRALTLAGARRAEELLHRITHEEQQQAGG